MILSDQQDIRKATVFMTLEASEDLAGVTHQKQEQPCFLHFNEVGEVVAIEINGFRLADFVYGETG